MWLMGERVAMDFFFLTDVWKHIVPPTELATAEAIITAQTLVILSRYIPLNRCYFTSLPSPLTLPPFLSELHLVF